MRKAMLAAGAVVTVAVVRRVRDSGSAKSTCDRSPFERRRWWWPGGEREWVARSWEELGQVMMCELGLNSRQRRLLRLRWLGEGQHYDKLWRGKRRAFSVVGMVGIAAGLATPLFAAFDAPKEVLASSGFVAGLAVATEGFFRFGERWRKQRHTAMVIKAEGIRFIEQRPPYDAAGGHEHCFPLFIDRLERINEAESEEYLSLLGRLFEENERRMRAQSNA